jgi:hypothetical protein
MITALVTVPGAAQAGWQQVGAAGFSAGEANAISLAVDKNGTPYVAYSDTANGGKASVMQFNGTSWVLVGPAGFSAGVPYEMSLALDKNNIPYLAYSECLDDPKLCLNTEASVMKLNNTSWEKVGGVSFTTAPAQYLSLAVDSNSIPYVAYQDGANSDKASVMKFATTWQYVGAAGFSTDLANDISLALDSSDLPAVAYQDTADANKVKVMKLTNSNWVQLGSAAGFSDDTANDGISLVIGSGNIPYVAYSDADNGGKVSVMKLESTDWTPVGAAGFSAGGIDYVSLTVAQAGTPYVAYQDGASSNKASMMQFNSSSSSWQQVGIAGFSAATADYVSLALDSRGTPYVAYKDGANLGNVSVMQFNSGGAVRPAPWLELLLLHKK